MGEIVNLRRARKAKAQVDREAAAAENRVRFGTPTALRKLAEKRRAEAAKTHDGHKRDHGKNDLEKKPTLPDETS
ncbi:hypothetical protein FP2506_18554 [Fulvimarina pelagi HTCC2506]|uniref:DUF4169 family protein n=1 Tax=Fulvimarina pelagi HTCC2506 TaxID=314231 RepID=Q0G0S2_9HYPH|nr:DUF4169 family protein [Fulvimarina pelagi]EAU40917.1 hypothetical protein FP2506_18554 [Fulvimarina pelagi HTCC2506]